MNDPAADITWLEAFKDGDKQTFKEVYVNNYRALYVFACGILQSDLTPAEDVVQECFQKLWNSRERMASEKHIRNFLYLAVRNACINILRHKSVLTVAHKEVAATSDKEDSNAETARVYAEVIAEMYRQVEALPSKYARVIRMFYFEEKSAAEVGQALGISPNAAMILKTRALKMLRLKVLDNSIQFVLFLLLFVHPQD